MTYEIQIKGLDGWSADYVGANNEFDSESDAWEGVAALQALGGEWAVNDDGSEVEYRVVETA